MNKILRTPIAIFLVLLAQTGFGDTPVYQVSDAQGTFIQVPLPHNIYSYSQQPDLRNLIVVDSEQHSLPYRLVTITPAPAKTEQAITGYPVPFFPVAADATPDTLRKLHTTQVNTSANGVQVATSDKILSNDTPDFYLIDISNIDQDLSGLGVDWNGDINNQYLEVELEATRNLQNWFSVARATLVKVSQQEQHVVRNVIDVNIAKKDVEFLRLRVSRGADNLQITAVTAIQKNEVQAEKNSAQEVWTLAGQRAKIQTTVYLPGSHSKSYPVAAWEFIRTEPAPINSVSLGFSNHSYGDSAKIFSRNSENQSWKLQYQGVWFNTQVGSEWQSSGAVSQNRNSDKYWRVELNESALDTLTPGLVFGWQPMQLQIVTNNKPPYALVVKDNPTGMATRDQVFNQILANTKPVWVSAGLIDLGVKVDAVTAPPKVIDWKQWLFWVALVLAVGVLLLFALRLLRQLRAGNAD